MTEQTSTSAPATSQTTVPPTKVVPKRPAGRRKPPSKRPSPARPVPPAAPAGAGKPDPMVAALVASLSRRGGPRADPVLTKRHDDLQAALHGAARASVARPRNWSGRNDAGATLRSIRNAVGQAAPARPTK
jgi:hypothetical protein